MQYQLMELHRKFKLPDIDFVLTTSDKCKPGDVPHHSYDGNMTRCEKLVRVWLLIGLAKSVSAAILLCSIRSLNTARHITVSGIKCDFAADSRLFWTLGCSMTTLTVTNTLRIN